MVMAQPITTSLGELANELDGISVKSTTVSPTVSVSLRPESRPGYFQEIVNELRRQLEGMHRGFGKTSGTEYRV